MLRYAHVLCCSAVKQQETSKGGGEEEEEKGKDRDEREEEGRERESMTAMKREAEGWKAEKEREGRRERKGRREKERAVSNNRQDRAEGGRRGLSKSSPPCIGIGAEQGWSPYFFSKQGLWWWLQTSLKKNKK